MKLARVSGTLSLFACAVVTSQFATAADAGWYIGANVGQSRAKIDDARITGGLIGSGFKSVSIFDDDRDTGYKIFGGYQITRNFAVEGGYFDLGKFGFTANTTPLGTLRGDIKIRGANLDLVGMLPFTEKFSAFGRVGVNSARAEDTFTGTGLVRTLNPNPRQRETNAKFGLGLQYAFTESLGIRAEVERYRINDAVGNIGDIDLVSVGLVYRFGAKRSLPVARSIAPDPVAAIPSAVAPLPIAAAPVVQPAAVPTPPPPLMKVTFSADALFDFDKATIKPAGKQALDKFAKDVSAIRYDVITMTGHTDRIGSAAYNVALSMRRADAVKNYLTQAAAIAPGKIISKAAGEANPVTKPGECKGEKATKALISCLQPDRRVEVEVTGTK